MPELKRKIFVFTYEDARVLFEHAPEPGCYKIL